MAVSVYVAGRSGPATWHQLACAYSYITADGSGDHSRDTSAGAFVDRTQGRFFVSGVDVRNPATRRTVVTLGDSITDGFGSTFEADNRYPGFLAERLLAALGARTPGFPATAS